MSILIAYGGANRRAWQPPWVVSVVRQDAAATAGASHCAGAAATPVA